MKKVLIVFLSGLLLFLVGILRISVVYSYYRAAEAATGNPETEELDADVLYDLGAFRNQTYYRKLLSWLESYAMVDLGETPVSLDAFIAANPEITFATPESYDGPVAELGENDTLAIEVTVLETGLYELGFDFRMPETFYTVPTIGILVNGESLYNEMSSLELDVAWNSVPLDESKRYNRYGNELLPDSAGDQTWRRYYFDDYNGYTQDNYQFLLESGTNTITVTALNLPIQIGNFYLQGHESTIDYDAYAAGVSGETSGSDGELIVIQGENFGVKNDLEVKPSYYKESAMTPYSYKNTVLNQLDGDSMSRGGTKVTYDFTVAKTGFYQIALKVLHNGNLGVAAGKNIYLDGQIPFAELVGYTFDSNRAWENVVLGDDGGEYRFYLSAGAHTLTIESTVSQYMAYIDRLNGIMDTINSISLTVQTITGGNADDAVDWDILKYIPALEATLLSCADALETMYDELDAIDGGMSSAPELSTLNVAAKQLRRVAKTPNRIGSKLAEFSEGSGSAYQLIGAAVASLLAQPLSVDCIYVYNDVELAKPMGSWFRKIWDGIRGFFYSFFDTRYNDIGVEPGTLEVWIQTSSLYLDIIQSMIDQDFTAQTGIPVKCSILSNASKIVLSNATNDNPDVVMSIDDWVPYAYALRGMLTDLTTFEDFDAVSAAYMANNFTPLIFGEGVYGIPETQSVFLLYYRTDILDYLGLDVPDTWDDVLAMLPILQSHQMNFFHPLGGDASFKGYGYTSSLIYQFGGEIYSEDGISSTLKDAETVAAIRFMTDLFTIYDLPLQVSSFFEHFRSGDMPIGISTIDLYLQLKYAAPELSGQWGASVIPGIDGNDDGTVERWATTYGKTSILFSDSVMQEEGWALIKWWNSAATQIDYMQNIKTGLGEKYLILTANMPALEASVWDEDIKKQILGQVQWARIPAITPGSYIVERELSSIWNKIVIDLSNVSVAINESIPRITRELNRKFDEFGYRTSTDSTGKIYVVPMNANISDWIPEGYADGE